MRKVAVQSRHSERKGRFMLTKVVDPSHQHELSFVCLDVETANCRRESICQIGLVTVCNGSIVDEFSTLVNPNDWFDPFNEEIHGISEKKVQNAPTFDEIYNEICNRIGNRIVVSHTSFDKIAILRVVEKHNLNPPSIVWLDSARIARRAWPDRFGKSGYGLANVTKELGISFKHHDALEDARAATAIVLRACNETGLSIEGWLERVGRPISLTPNASPNASPDANKDGPLYGEHIVFTGELSIPRREASQIVAGVGCNVQKNVTKKTTLLVVGILNDVKFASGHKTTKQLKAERLVASGQSIQILSESDFWAAFGEYQGVSQ